MLNDRRAFVKPNDRPMERTPMPKDAGRTGAPLAVIAASLRAERRRAGLSLAEVARRAGIAKSTLSQLESGTGNPSIETLWALGIALDVPFARLVSERADYVATLLASCPPNARRDIYHLTVQPGTPRESEPHMPGVIEHIVLSSGRARVGITDNPVELAPGDYIAYPGDQPHVFEALEPDTTAVIVSEHI
jgi:transcriptional regulator with XRE-family HTH domain